MLQHHTCCALHDVLVLEWDSAAVFQMMAITAEDQQERLCICYWRTTSSCCFSALGEFDLHSKQLSGRKRLAVALATSAALFGL